MNVKKSLLGALALLAVAACTPAQPASGPVTITLLAHDSFVVSKEALAAFRKETGITVDVVTAGDAGTMVASAVLAAGNPTADVLFGIDNTLMPSALKGEGIFTAYESPLMDQVRGDVLQWTDGHFVTPIDFGDVCINADTKWFTSKAIPIPASIDELTDRRYKDLLVVQDPATSSPGMAFLLAVYARFGSGSENFWKGLKANGVKVAGSWSDAYFNEFSAGGGSGSRPLVVSYATSPVAEFVYAAEPKPTSVSTSVVTQGCFRQIEYAGILRGSSHVPQAQQVIDWLLSPEFQNDVATNMFVYPVLATARVAPEFEKFAGKVEQPGMLSTDALSSLQPKLLQEWNRVMDN